MTNANTNVTKTYHIERFLTVGPSSLISDAPGWGEFGPVCWKCRGHGRSKRKATKRERSHSTRKTTDERTVDACDGEGGTRTATSVLPKDPTCPVCAGAGRLPARIDRSVRLGAGIVTSARRPIRKQQEDDENDDEAAALLCPYALAKTTATASAQEVEALALVRAAKDGQRVEVPEDLADRIPWLPRRSRGEQLCNLTGRWRILQVVNGHRWTTDDLVTAHTARKELSEMLLNLGVGPQQQQRRQPLRYLDLGCGNGSVLQMVCRSALELLGGVVNQKQTFLPQSQSQPMIPRPQDLVKACGIEARSEAVDLARRSLAFNAPWVEVLRGDFREIQKVLKVPGDGDRPMSFDLVTGTPPYFRVDFVHSKDNDHDHNNLALDSLPTALVAYGGMPTELQSAPARCEYRGGIEAYCEAAATVLSPPTKAEKRHNDNGEGTVDTGTTNPTTTTTQGGIFVVAESSLHRTRVEKAADTHGLRIRRRVSVKGKTTANQCLFDVYVMERRATAMETMTTTTTDPMLTPPPLCVRNERGQWTAEYAQVLEEMGIPAKHTHESKKAFQ